MATVSQALIDALNRAETAAATATAADGAAVASATKAADDQKAAADAHAASQAGYKAALAAFYAEFGVTPSPAP